MQMECNQCQKAIEVILIAISIDNRVYALLSVLSCSEGVTCMFMEGHLCVNTV